MRCRGRPFALEGLLKVEVEITGSLNEKPCERAALPARRLARTNPAEHEDLVGLDEREKQLRVNARIHV
jgi:hypothetical protein